MEKLIERLEYVLVESKKILEKPVELQITSDDDLIKSTLQTMRTVHTTILGLVSKVENGQVKATTDSYSLHCLINEVIALHEALEYIAEQAPSATD